MEDKMKNEKDVAKELVKIYLDYRDYYDGKKFKIEMNQDFADDHGYENMWWINLEIVDAMWDDIFKLFKKKDVKKKFDELRKKLNDKWEKKQKEFTEKQKNVK